MTNSNQEEREGFEGGLDGTTNQSFDGFTVGDLGRIDDAGMERKTYVSTKWPEEFLPMREELVQSQCDRVAEEIIEQGPGPLMTLAELERIK